MTLIMSRIFYCKNVSDEDSYMVVPYWDMPNFDTKKRNMCEWGFNNKNNCFYIVAK